MAKGNTYSPARIADRIRALGRQISKDARGRRLDVVVTMDNGFVFAADLVRNISSPVVMHFIREDVRDIELAGRPGREVFFADRANTSAETNHASFQGRDVLLVDAILDSGVTQEFLLRRIGENKPRSLRLAVLLDKVSRRRVALEPDYFGFRTASNLVWSGFGLAASNGTGRNSRSLVAGSSTGKSKRRKKKS